MKESIQLTLKRKQEGDCRRSIGDTSLLMSQKGSHFMYSLYILKAPEWKCWKSWSHLVFNSLWLLLGLQWSLSSGSASVVSRLVELMKETAQTSSSEEIFMKVTVKTLVISTPPIFTDDLRVPQRLLSLKEANKPSIIPVRTTRSNWLSLL